MDIRSSFEMRRHHKDFHLGLGDIRLSMGDQESIAAEFERLRQRIAALEEEQRELLGLLEEAEHWLPDEDPVCPVSGPIQLRERILAALAPAQEPRS